MTPKDKEAITELLCSLQSSINSLRTVVQDQNLIMFLNEIEESIGYCIVMLDY